MPSIPQSLLWISLVVLWLFVLVPMLINKRETVRRTSDVALATRVLNSGAKSRLKKRSGPAAGHRHDPDWQHDEELAGEFAEDFPEASDETEEFAVQQEAIKVYDDAVREARMGTARMRSVVVVAAVTEQPLSEPDYLDVDIVEENSGALPVGGAGFQASLFDTDMPADQSEKLTPPVAPIESEPAAKAAPRVEKPASAPIADKRKPAAVTPEPADADDISDEYENIDETAELEDDEDASTPVAPPRSASRQRRMETSSADAISARKYRFRKRVLTTVAALMVLTAGLAFTVSPAMWWAFGATAGVMVLYLGYLRRQTRIEEQVRRRRQQRMARTRPTVEEAAPPRRPEVDFTEFPTRLQRPGAVVLEIDDEDPIFEHLEEVAYGRRRYNPPQNLARAAGQ